MGNTEVGSRLTLPVANRGRVQTAFFDVFKSKRSSIVAGLSYRCMCGYVLGDKLENVTRPFSQYLWIQQI